MSERELERMEERAEAAELYVNLCEKFINALFTKSLKVCYMVSGLLPLCHFGLSFLCSRNYVSIPVWILRIALLS